MSVWILIMQNCEYLLHFHAKGGVGRQKHEQGEKGGIETSWERQKEEAGREAAMGGCDGCGEANSAMVSIFCLALSLLSAAKCQCQSKPLFSWHHSSTSRLRTLRQHRSHQRASQHFTWHQTHGHSSMHAQSRSAYCCCCWLETTFHKIRKKHCFWLRMKNAFWKGFTRLEGIFFNL